MSILEGEPLAALSFYRSSPLPCPYLPDRLERKLFTKLEPETAYDVNSALIREGFRRSHDIVYRPVCPTCSACTPVRIPVGEFTASRSQRRTMSYNQNLTLQVVLPVASDQQYDLFTRYQNARHSDGSMASMTMDEYSALIKEQGSNTSSLFLWHDEERTLKCVMLVDLLHDGYSAVYSFFDPDISRNSYGTFMILALINEARRTNRPYIYLGYYIESLPKMAYKANFQPLEAITRIKWEKSEI